MKDKSEFDLLSDIAKLLKKYGPDTFEMLANHISDPQFFQTLSKILTTSGTMYHETEAVKTKDRLSLGGNRSFKDFLRNLEKTEPEKSVVLLQLYDGLQSKTFLPTLRDIINFVDDVALPPITVSSREKALIPFVKLFLPLSLDEIRTRLQKLQPVSTSSNRSLDGWSKIIFGQTNHSETS